ncbi:hypothetical protein Bca4012_037334 [Brassica carinata]
MRRMSCRAQHGRGSLVVLICGDGEDESQLSLVEVYITDENKTSQRKGAWKINEFNHDSGGSLFSDKQQFLKTKHKKNQYNFWSGVQSESSNSSPHLRAQLLRPRCRRCEVSSTSGHRSSSRLVNIGFSTFQAYDLSISKSCSHPSPSCLCSVVADSPLNGPSAFDSFHSGSIVLKENHVVLFFSGTISISSKPSSSWNQKQGIVHVNHCMTTMPRSIALLEHVSMEKRRSWRRRSGGNLVAVSQLMRRIETWRQLRLCYYGGGEPRK